MSSELEHNVQEFHLKFGHPVALRPSITHQPQDVIEFRIGLIKEECKELCEALEARDLAKIAAEAVDVIYVVVGTLVVLGLPLMPFWRDVQRANMNKQANPDGGKPLKPNGWEGPNPTRVLQDIRNR